MDIVTLRNELNLSQQDLAELCGLSSKGHVSQIERGAAKPSVAVALKIEELSRGRIPADVLNDDVRLVRSAPKVEAS